MSNLSKGNAFQERARHVLERLVNEPFDSEVKLPIGSPPRIHRFDLVSESRIYVVECKAFAYTTSGRNPSSKISTLREAMQYLNLAPAPMRKLLVMERHHPEGKRESLAVYFARLNEHLRGDVTLLELDDTHLRVLAGEPLAQSTFRRRL